MSSYDHAARSVPGTRGVQLWAAFTGAEDTSEHALIFGGFDAVLELDPRCPCWEVWLGLALA
jgi:hypothetical protein